MLVPSGMSEAEVVAALEEIGKILSAKYDGHVPGFSRDDLRQECVLYGIEALNKNLYDHRRPLRSYLYVAIGNRVRNLLRNRLGRNDSPCERCNAGNLCGDGVPCEAHARFRRAQDARNRCQSLLPLPVDADTGQSMEPADPASDDDAVEGRDLQELLDRELPVLIRADYLTMLSGISIPPQRRDKVREEVRRVLDEAGYPMSGLWDEVDEEDALAA